MGDVIEILTTATNTVEVEAQGPQGIPGVGVPTGGSALQVLRKKTGTDYDTEWAAAGSGSGSVTSVALASTDLTISGSPITDSGTITANIAANAVTLEKLQTISSEHLLGRHGSGNGGVQQIGLGTGLAISGSNVRVATTGITAGTYTKLTIDETGRATVGATATPQDIGAQSLFVTEVLDLDATGSTTLPASRAKIWNVGLGTNSSYNVTLPTSGHIAGDIVVIQAANIPSGATILIRIDQSVIAQLRSGQSYRYIALGSSATDWGEVPVDSHPADRITSGTLAYERGGLEADVSAYNGLVKISGGSTSAVGIGTGSTEVAAGDHVHGNLTSDGKLGSTSGLPVVTTTAGAVTTLALGTANQVLRVNSGASGVEFADPAASGVTGAAASASDVLGVSGANITGVDATADRIVFWDDSASALKYLEAGSGLSISGTTLTATASGGSKTYSVFTALDNNPPSTAFATLDTRNSIAVLDFDDATDESAVFVSIIPEGASLGSGLKIRLHWMATTATSGNVVWDVSLERMTSDLDADDFDTIASGTAAANGTSGILTVTEITLTTIDSVTAGDGFRLKVTRDANNGSDTMTGDAELVVCEVRSAA